MARFLTTSKTMSKLEDIIREAREELVLISAFWKPRKNYLDRLKDAAEREVKISVVYGKSELEQEVMNAFKEIPGIRIYYLDELHAKCYMNENELIISSMNLYDASEMRNREMSVLVGKVHDAQLFEEASEEARSILQAASRTNGETYVAMRRHEQHLPDVGYCIRCKSERRFEPYFSLCDIDFATWVGWGNLDWPENYCHWCGKERRVTKAVPFCRECSKEFERITGKTFDLNKVSME